MTSQDILLIGLARRVAAISRTDGQELWSTDLGGNIGVNFVTVVSDEKRVFAHAGGHLHCLDLLSGALLWTNKLAGYGYGLASLAIPGHALSDATVAKRAFEQRAANQAAGVHPTL
jgi:outer membrane protein assembly factor BamB